MKGEDKTQEQLLNELVDLRQRIAELEASEAERRRTEEALRKSEARFRTIFEGAAIDLGITDLEGRTVEANPALQEILGYSREELRGMAFTEVTHPDDAAADKELFKELVAGKRDHY